MPRASARSSEPTKHVQANSSGRLTKQRTGMPSACIRRRVPLRAVACAGAISSGVGALGVRGLDAARAARRCRRACPARQCVTRAAVARRHPVGPQPRADVGRVLLVLGDHRPACICVRLPASDGSSRPTACPMVIADMIRHARRRAPTHARTTPMAHVSLIGNLRQYTGGVTELDVEAANVRQLFARLGETYPALAAAPGDRARPSPSTGRSTRTRCSSRSAPTATCTSCRRSRADESATASRHCRRRREVASP